MHWGRDYMIHVYRNVPCIENISQLDYRVYQFLKYDIS
jgi:hypothetical protein